jgi:hypothetical protein
MVSLMPQGAFGTVKDIELSKLLYKLFAEILNCLCHIGSAYEEDPELELN